MTLAPKPLILTHDPGTDLVIEGDCACPIAPSLNVLQQIEAVSWKAPPSVYEASLPGEHQLVFNYFGQTSLGVLNESAYQVWNEFRDPIELKSIPEKIPSLSPDQALLTARNLISLGLLIPAEKFYPSQLSDNTETLTVWLHVTNACNLSCDYCYLNKTHEQLDVERGKQAIDAIFRSALANGFKRIKLKYAGGEATLNFKLILLLNEYAQQLASLNCLGLDAVILTNGVALSRSMIEDIRVHGLRLSISLDGIGEAHDSQRKFINGHGSFSHVDRALDRLKTFDIKPSITITVSARNVSGLSDTVRYVIARELPFTINFYRENECSATFADLAYQDEEIISSMLSAFRVIEENLPPHSLLGSLVDRARLDGMHDRPCGVGHSYLVIDQKGGVAKCHMDIEHTVTDISVEDPLQFIRLDKIGVQNHPVSEKEGCRDCEWRYWCAGGCPALTRRVTGRYDVKSPNCRIYKALFPEVLRLEGLRLLKFGSPYNYAS